MRDVRSPDQPVDEPVKGKSMEKALREAELFSGGFGMWTCPKCGREFGRTNQGHYCGRAPESVDEYMEAQAPEARAHIAELRNLIRRCIPGIGERIAWSMPLFEADGRSVSFAACKKHISFYLDAETLEAVQPRLGDFEIRKNALYLPYSRELPVGSLEEAVKLYFQAEQRR